MDRERPHGRVGWPCTTQPSPCRQEPGAEADAGARAAGAGAAGAAPRRPEPQRPEPDREAGRTLGHGRRAVLDEGGSLVLVLRGRRPLHLGCRRLARREEGRPLGGAGAGPPAGAGPHGRLRQGDRPGPRSAARLVARSTGPNSSRPRSSGAASAPRPPMWASRSATASQSASSTRSRRSASIDFETLEEARAVIGAFVERYNNGWLLQRYGYMTPARAREKLSRKAA